MRGTPQVSLSHPFTGDGSGPLESGWRIPTTTGLLTAVHGMKVSIIKGISSVCIIPPVEHQRNRLRWASFPISGVAGIWRGKNVGTPYKAAGISISVEARSQKGCPKELVLGRQRTTLFTRERVSLPENDFIYLPQLL